MTTPPDPGLTRAERLLLAAAAQGATVLVIESRGARTVDVIEWEDSPELSRYGSASDLRFLPGERG
jgi:hypothetical protein